MQDPAKELPGLIHTLLQAPADQQRALIERHFASDCRLTHALCSGRNREDIIRIFQFWRFANVRLSADIREVFVSSEGDKAFVQLIQHITCFLHGPIGFDLGMSSVLYLRDSPSGKLICKQVDLHQFESILYHWTLLGPLLEVLVRGVVTMQILGSARLAAWAWGLVERGWSAALPATATAEGASAFGAPEAQGKAAEGSRAGASAGQGACARSGVLRWVQRAAAAVWWREWLWRSRPGRLTVPYNMQ